MIDDSAIRVRWDAISPLLSEHQRRIWAGAEAHSHGRGGIAVVMRVTGLSRNTVRKGVDEVISGETLPQWGTERIRAEGAGRPTAADAQPGLREALDALIDPVTLGSDSESLLRWTSKSLRKLRDELRAQDFVVTHETVRVMLHEMGYSLQSTRKRLEGASHPERDEQFRFIADKAKSFADRGQPVVSIDTKKKELVGQFSNRGQEWRPKGDPIDVNVHDFPSQGDGRAVPYGVYDVFDNTGWVSVGMSYETAEFAVNALRSWWVQMGCKTYPNATEVMVTADCGGANRPTTRLWWGELQKLADETGLTIHVTHFPPGTSKWNKIEHRMFAHITMNWRGRPLESFETIVNLISSTTTQTGLRIEAQLDDAEYAKGVKLTDEQIDELNMTRDEIRGRWNYSFAPRE